MVPYLSHTAHDGELLRGDEGLEHDADGHVDVVLVNVVPQVDPGVGLGHPDHRLNVTHRDGNTARRLRGQKARVNCYEVFGQPKMNRRLLWTAQLGLKAACRIYIFIFLPPPPPQYSLHFLYFSPLFLRCTFYF